MNRSDFLAGLRSGFVVAVSSAPFAVLFGAVAVDNGLSVLDVGLMSALVFAGASQLVGIELFGSHVPAWLIVLSILAVNFRHVLYSAALAPMFSRYSPMQRLLAFFLLTDPQYADAIRRSETNQSLSFTWYLTFGLVVWLQWGVFSVLGAWFGGLLGDPRTFAIDVLLPIYFLGLVVTFRRRTGFYPVVLASMTGAVLAYHFVGSPWHVSIGAVLGILVAVLLPAPLAQARSSVAPEAH
ncbi:AzlC family ABC transporter permease [Devosia sp. 1635]|uniref:AzlC family ABC transporter permease n=1 Tax=Devosia sp. 1635 TaxID=2726066 RepID=UPI001564F066|nr:AzlC family ABC transporter permease [Devosia sp. 1635]